MLTITHLINPNNKLNGIHHIAHFVLALSLECVSQIHRTESKNVHAIAVARAIASFSISVSVCRLFGPVEFEFSNLLHIVLSSVDVAIGFTYVKHNAIFIFVIIIIPIVMFTIVIIIIVIFFVQFDRMKIVMVTIYKSQQWMKSKQLLHMGFVFIVVPLVFYR